VLRAGWECLIAQKVARRAAIWTLDVVYLDLEIVEGVEHPDARPLWIGRISNV
jgi:hypothetical protein